MNKVLRFALAPAALLLLLCASAPAADAPAEQSSSPISGLILTPQIGTLGIGINIGWQFNDIIKARFNANYMALNTSRKISDIDCDMDYSSATFGLLADIHPFSGHLRVTGGLYYVNMNGSVTADLKNDKSYTVGDNTYRGSELGSGDGSVKWQRFAPYVGLGFGTGEGADSGFSFHADVGALFFGDPKVSMGFTKSRVNDALADDINKYEDKAKKDIRSYLPVWPVLSLGVSYRFERLTVTKHRHPRRPRQGRRMPDRRGKTRLRRSP